MSFLDTLSADLKSALISGDKMAATTLRMLKSELKNAEIAAGTEMKDEDMLQVVRKEVKKRQEAVTMLENAGKTEMADQEKAEAALLQKYLPAQVPVSEVEAYVQTLKSGSPDLQKGDLIRQTLAYFSGRTDGRTVSEAVNRL